MPRVITAEGMREIDYGGQRYYSQGGRRGYEQGGRFEMPDHAARVAVRMGGAIASLAGGTRRTLGYRCQNPACRFGSFTRRCGRCGGRCERE